MMSISSSAALKWLLLSTGTLSVAYYTLRLISFLYLHFVHGCRLPRYLPDVDEAGRPSWALVTGATDGIGRCFAEDLSRRGFNVVIHGRNMQKLEALKRTLQQQYPGRSFMTVRMDAATKTNEPSNFQKVADALKDVNLRVLINNVGGSGGLMSFMPLHERPSNEIQTIMNINDRFPIEITRALLPQLRRNQPSLIMNIGSTSSEFGVPYLSIYSACKAANRAWSRCLSAEMRADYIDIEVLCIWISRVATNYVPRAASLTTPTAKQMASYALDKVGCGKSLVFGYWFHEIEAIIYWALPTWLQDRLIIEVGKKERADDERRSRQS